MHPTVHFRLAAWIKAGWMLILVPYLLLLRLITFGPDWGSFDFHSADLSNAMNGLVPPLVFVPAAALVAWIFCLRPRVSVTSDTISIVESVSRAKIPISSVEAIFDRCGKVVIAVQGRREVVAGPLSTRVNTGEVSPFDTLEACANLREYIEDQSGVDVSSIAPDGSGSDRQRPKWHFYVRPSDLLFLSALAAAIFYTLK
ncbi:hypothetical protein ABZ479_38205 [Streptomyces sp. NPDC005722]